MTTVTFTRPDGRPGTYADWRAEVQAQWQALTPGEREESRLAAYARHRAQQPRNDAGPSVLNLYDEIGFFGLSAADLVQDIQGIRGDLTLNVNSPGGDVFGGISIFNALKQRQGRTSVSVDGLAASCASFIAMAADPGELRIGENATMMIHEAWGGVVGDARDMADMAKILDAQSQNIASIYAGRSGIPADCWRDLMRAETWAVGKEAVELGLADGLLGSGQPAPVQPVTFATWQVTIVAGKKKKIKAEKYSADDRKRMASSGEAMEDGSYPIADSEDLDNAIHAVGRGGSDHDAIRRHIISRAKALGLSSRIPDNWNADGSIGPADHLDPGFEWTPDMLSNLLEALKGATK